ncbi:unannotated protein [freshwater metagenome]|uniref:Unannotated protein n=1 Tax=freshwater metagenome TaxID=449393 RepID=A0A6J6GP01_9ZZZZ|nr:cytidine deaminase [Actinomycetota bacterium]
MNNPEDLKLVTLATSTLTRSGAQQAAALRDNTGRTYVAINVASPELTLDACEAVLTVALASGITGIESVVYAGTESARIQVIKAFDTSASIFYFSPEGQTHAL